MAGPTEEDAEALYEYSRRGKVAEVRVLLERGVAPDRFVAYDGSTAVVIAARGGHGEVVGMLLAAGAALDTRTDDGSALLVHAASGGSVEAARALLRSRADPNEANEDGVTPLMLAGDVGHVEVIRLLLDARADVSVVAEEWGSALDAAEASGHAEVAALLAAAGARPADPASRAGERKVAAGEKWGYDAFDGEKDIEARGPALLGPLPPRVRKWRVPT
eukprot:CAMPEP_0176262212 /NCGR_PEP_ID=MMETSP0121_2-20121125/40494_1 /TAXON_ID=160619 /ORGANISM="Kryptoperidinium foliaceum, Strain CCMP 1326" /LENGTH=218 /DNA_ID=CAMNT_0017602171 /DNA_START=1 /DNA_END=654 /DNA_ORIENTATION=-